MKYENTILNFINNGLPPIVKMLLEVEDGLYPKIHIRAECIEIYTKNFTALNEIHSILIEQQIPFESRLMSDDDIFLQIMLK